MNRRLIGSGSQAGIYSDGQFAYKVFDEDSAHFAQGAFDKHQRLAHIEAVCKCYSIDGATLKLELVEGCTLYDLDKSKWPADTDAQVRAALEAVYACGESLASDGVYLTNIMVTGSGRIVLIDMMDEEDYCGTPASLDDQIKVWVYESATHVTANYR